MMRPLIGWGLAALLFASPASAQQGTTELRGKVTDAQGAILPGVTLTVTNQESGMFRATTSGPDGTFIASGLVPGSYKLTASLQGFKKVERKDLRLEVGKTVSIDVAMTLGSFEETVSVTATSPLVDITSKEIGGNITSETLVQLPSVNGNFIGFIGLLPGIVPSISTESFGGDSVSVNGQDPRNNNYMLDGGNNNDDVIGQRAGMQARTPIEAVQEFQVISGQYDAEFGRTSGGIINAVTKQGSNVYRRQRVWLLPGRQPVVERLFLGEERIREGRHEIPTLGRHDRRANRPQQALLLWQPRAVFDRPAQHDQHCGPAGAERPAADERPRVEHDHPRRPPGEREQHVRRALAARDVAADEPDHHAAVDHARCSPRGVGRRPDADWILQPRDEQHDGQHDAPHMDA